MMRRASTERGSALIWAILLMIIVAGLVGAFSMVAQRAGDRSADASRRVSNAATTQTAVTRVIFGLQNGLGSEADYYVLDRADLRDIVDGVTGVTVYAPNQLRNLPADHFGTFGVYERQLNGNALSLVQLATLPTDTIVEEPVLVDAQACRTVLRLPAATCSGGQVRAYWQVARVIVPDTTGRSTSNVIVTVRTWLGDRTTGTWTKSSYATAEMRPGRFADFQLISDGNIRFGDGAELNGPVHSNGLDDSSYATVPTIGMPNLGASWVFGDPGMRCVGNASISITSGVVAGAAGRRTCNSQGATGQTISFMRAIDAMDQIQQAVDDGRPNVRAFTANNRRGAEAGRDAHDTAWRVQLSGNSMSVTYPDNSRSWSVPLNRVNAFVFDEDVRVSGRVAANVRVTVAARRAGGGSASIYIDDDITKGDDRTSSIGLLAQGNVVIWQTQANPCAVTTVEAAMVAATGGITIPSKYTTDEVQRSAPQCSARLKLDGSFAAHRPPTLFWGWDSGDVAGYTRSRAYMWDQQLKRNPPPYFPLTGTWQPFNVRDANVDCLYTRRTDAQCT
ncbi:MAG: hypothetical protein JWM86_1652 [Thermoleophilia bacterium]|nr:hypothetical protein [Thermoleophilia bacterium]